MELEELLHPRIINNCLKLFKNGHYKQAALEAMTAVELALKEKSGVENKYGIHLISQLFGKNKGIKLRVPFGDNLQNKAEGWFKGAFSYYRNYLAHDGRKVDKLLSARIMIIASDLLDLIGASSKSFDRIGGINGLVKSKVFKDEDGIKKLLKILDGYCLPDHICDGFYEELAEKGYGEDEVLALIEIGLVEYKSREYIPHPNEPDDFIIDEIGCFELTPLGKKVLNKIEKNNKYDDKV